MHRGSQLGYSCSQACHSGSTHPLTCCRRLHCGGRHGVRLQAVWRHQRDQRPVGAHGQQQLGRCGSRRRGGRSGGGRRRSRGGGRQRHPQQGQRCRQLVSAGLAQRAPAGRGEDAGWLARQRGLGKSGGGGWRLGRRRGLRAARDAPLLGLHGSWRRPAERERGERGRASRCLLSCCARMGLRLAHSELAIRRSALPGHSTAPPPAPSSPTALHALENGRTCTHRPCQL